MFKLNIAAAQDKRDAFREEEDHVAGKEVTVQFELPSGETAEATFRMGHAVERLKAYVEDKHSIPYASMELMINGKRMADPLSLNDIKDVQVGEVNVVQVVLSEEDADGKDDKEDGNDEDE